LKNCEVIGRRSQIVVKTNLANYLFDYL